MREVIANMPDESPFIFPGREPNDHGKNGGDVSINRLMRSMLGVAARQSVFYTAQKPRTRGDLIELVGAEHDEITAVIKHLIDAGYLAQSDEMLEVTDRVVLSNDGEKYELTVYGDEPNTSVRYRFDMNDRDPLR